MSHYTAGPHFPRLRLVYVRQHIIQSQLTPQQRIMRYCVNVARLQAARLRSVFPCEVYDLTLGSGFRPTLGGRDLGLGGGQVCIPRIGKGRRIFNEAGLGQRGLRIGRGGRNLVLPPPLGVLLLLSRSFLQFGAPMVARHCRWLSGSCGLWKRII